MPRASVINRSKHIKAIFILYAQVNGHRLAHRAGVTSAITPPSSSGLLSGLSVAFSTGAANKLAPSAVLQDVAALHVTLVHGNAALPGSVSTHVAILRRLLLQKQSEHGEADWWGAVREVGCNTVLGVKVN